MIYYTVSQCHAEEELGGFVPYSHVSTKVTEVLVSKFAGYQT